MNAISSAPIEIDPRPCGLCGLTVNHHDMVDDGEGPIFYCADVSPDEMTLEELERRAELIRQLEIADMVERMERADPRDAWKHTGEAPPPPEVRNGPTPEPARQSNRPAQSTIDAFLHLARHDPERLPGWLANHPQDAPELFKIWKAK
jgi:hypothetical protein